MNTYIPVRKIMKVVSTHRIPKRECHSSLSECLESSKDQSRRRRCKWKPWIILLLFSSALFYVYSRRNRLFPEMYEQGMGSNIITYYVEKPDEYIPQNMDVYGKSSTTSDTPEDIYKNDTLDAAIELHLDSQQMPHCILKKPYRKVKIEKTSVSLTADHVYPLVKRGGYYRPPDCKSKHRVAIIVPYRYREHNLGIFLYNIHSFLMQQKIEYQIFVIEQDGDEPFNKGRLFNAGFREMMKFNTFQCLVLHDLDLLPLDPNILYTCPIMPRHLCARVDDTEVRNVYNVTYDYKSLFGGVISVSVEQFERANGYSNLYFGWGGEDNDMFWRLRASGYPVVRYNKSIGVYTVLPHIRQPANLFRHHLLSGALDRYKTDGLSNLEYFVVSTNFRHLFTHIVVDINPRQDNITELNNKWGNPTKSIYKI